MEIAPLIFSGEKEEEIKGYVKDDIKKAIIEVKNEGNTEDQYVKKYLKNRLAEIEKVETLKANNIYVARVYYYSYWSKLTSSFRASVEIRHIGDLNKKYDEEEGWSQAHLVNQKATEDHTIHLGEKDYIDISHLENGQMYEVRIVDYSYDSDEPPTLPFRFRAN